MPPDKASLGQRFVCFGCDTRFYDLNRPEPTCPSCGVNQREEPEGGAERPATTPAPKEAAPKEAEGDSDTEEVEAIISKEEDDEEEDGGLSELGVPEMGEADEGSDD